MAGKGEQPPPVEVELEHFCRTKSVPLVAGGMLDQPIKATKRNASAYSVYQAFQTYTNFPGTDVEFSRQLTGLWDIVTDVEMNYLNDS